MPTDSQGITWDPAPQPVRQQGQRAGGVIITDPMARAEEERRQAEEARRREDQARQAREEALRVESEGREEAKFEATGGGGTEGQARTAALLSRITGGFADIQEIANRNPAAQEPGVVESVRGSLAPSGLWGIAVRDLAGEDRRMVHDAQRDILDALLTLGTGAAYNAEQLEGQMVSYFPQYGDTAAEIESKNRRLRRQVEAAKIAAGPYADDLEAAIAPFLPPLANALGASGESEPGVTGEAGAFMTPEDRQFLREVRAAYAAGATLEELKGIAAQHNRTISVSSQAELDAARREGRDVTISPSGFRPEEASILGVTPDSEAGAAVIGAANALLSGGMDELAPIFGLDAEMAQAAKDYLREQFPTASFVGEVAGQAGQIAGVTKALGAAGMGARTAAATAEVGGGAAYGAGESNDNRVLGGLTGGGAAVGGRWLGNKIASRLGSPEAQAAIARVAEDAGVPEAEVTRVLQEMAQAAPEAPLTESAQQEVAALARQATGIGPGARGARKTLARMAQIDPEAQAAADRLGVELPVDILSDNAQVRSLAGLARSQAGSDAEAAWQSVSARVSDQAERALADLGASTDLAQVSDDVLQRLNSSMQSLERQGATLRREVDEVINVRDRVETANVGNVIGEIVADLGGDDAARAALTAQEKELLALTLGGQPTYARLNRLRDEIGEALFRGRGPWADTSQANLSRYYGALADDQLAYIDAKGGTELADKMRASNTLFSQMYDARRDMQTLFGRQLDASLSPLLSRAIRSGSRGDTKAITQLLDRVPEDMRGPALLSAIMAQSRSSAAHGGFSFPNYTKLYRGLRENGPVYSRVAQAIGPEGEQILTDLYAISRRMADGETRVLKTGKANQAMAAAMQADGLIGGVLRATTRRVATGATAAAGGVVAGPGGAFAGASLAEGVAQSLGSAGRSRLDRAHALLSSSEFRTLVDRIGNAEPTEKAINAVENSRAFNRFAEAVGLDPKGRRGWITALMASAATVGAERPLNPEGATSTIEIAQ